MRWLPAVLLAAGLILGVVLPIAGFGRLPFLLGVVCLAAAGIAAARQTGRGLFALAGIAAAVLLFFVPGFVTGRRNDEGIAWVAPKGERVVLAEAGFAITSSSHDGTITARDLATGARRWRKTLLGKEHFASQLLVRRVGDTLLVVDREGALRGFDLKTGKQRWDAPPPSDSVIPAIASPELLASYRCEEKGCEAEVRSIADGSVRWHAPTARAPWLGSPPIAQSLGADRSLWPASAVILRTPPEGKRYEVRRLDTGKVLARGDAEHEAVTVIGNLFVREDGDGVLSATDITSGEQIWKRVAADRLQASRTPDGSLEWLGLPDGGLILTSGLSNTEDLPVSDLLRVLDPRTGKLTEHPVGDLMSNSVRAVPADGPEITAETATAGVAPRVPVLWSPFHKKVSAGGRILRTGLVGIRGVEATATQVGWDRDVHAFASGDRNGAVVYDRRTGRRLVRYAAKKGAFLRSEGERLVIAADGRDSVVKP